MVENNLLAHSCENKCDPVTEMYHVVNGNIRGVVLIQPSSLEINIKYVDSTLKCVAQFTTPGPSSQFERTF